MDKSKMLARLKEQTFEQNEKLKADIANALKKNESDVSARAWQLLFAEFEQDEMAVEEHNLHWRKKGQQHRRYGYHDGIEVIAIEKDGGNHTGDVKEVWQIYIKGKAFLERQHRIEDARRLASEEFFKKR